MSNQFTYDIAALQADPKATAEEVRRATIADSAATRIGHFISDLQGLREKDLRNSDTLKAVIVTGTKLLELGLHTKGRLKAAEGRSDAFLEATAANVKTAFRQAVSVMDECDLDLGAWGEALEIAKPAVEDLTRISKSLERPGVKTAVTPAVPEKAKPEPAPRIFEENGAPTPEAELPAEATPMPCAAPLPALGYTAPREEGAIDVEVVDVSAVVQPHPLDGLTPTEQETVVYGLLDKLEEAGIQEAGLKRKDWKKAQEAWMSIWLEDDEESTHQIYDALTFALDKRQPLSWAVPTVEEMQAHVDAQNQAEADEASETAQLDAAVGE